MRGGYSVGMLLCEPLGALHAHVSLSRPRFRRIWPRPVPVTGGPAAKQAATVVSHALRPMTGFHVYCFSSRVAVIGICLVIVLALKHFVNAPI